MTVERLPQKSAFYQQSCANLSVFIRRSKGVIVMKFKTVFIVAIVIYFVFGLAFIFFPEFMIMRFTKESVLSIPTLFFVRWWGAALLGLGATLLFSLKASPDSIGMRALYIGHGVGHGLHFFVGLADIIGSSPKPTIWIMMVYWFVMTILFGLLAFKKKA
jgi:hypothetical protein